MLSSNLERYKGALGRSLILFGNIYARNRFLIDKYRNEELQSRLDSAMEYYKTLNSEDKNAR